MKIDLVNNRGKSNLRQLLEAELKSCVRFDIGVAFMSDGALSLLDVFLHRNRNRLRGGRILVSLYNSFNSKAVLERLQQLDAGSGKLQVRISTNRQFHWKYYYFQSASQQTIFVGSANFTSAGLEQPGELTTRFRLGSAERKKGEDFEHLYEKEWKDAIGIREVPLSLYKQIKAPAAGGLHPDIRKLLKNPGSKQRAVPAAAGALQKAVLVSGYFSAKTMRLVSAAQSHWDKQDWNYFSVATRTEFRQYTKQQNLLIVWKQGHAYTFYYARVMGDCMIDTPEGNYFIAYQYVSRPRRETPALRAALEALGFRYRARSFYTKAIRSRQSNELIALLFPGLQ